METLASELRRVNEVVVMESCHWSITSTVLNMTSEQSQKKHKNLKKNKLALIYP